MKVAFVFMLIVAVATASVAFDSGLPTNFLELEGAKCFPNCAWNCDRPVCPAKCTPQCEKPQCELRCEKLAATNCDIRCEKPKCEVRCSKDNCQNGGCPICENVCMPAKCQTVCTPQKPVCKPVCSAPKCNWSCIKPASCPRPKCSLQCAAKAGETPACSQGSCCSCNKFQNMASAIEIANSAHVAKHGESLADHLMPEFIEVAHEMRHTSQVTGSEGCCPCQA